MNVNLRKYDETRSVYIPPEIDTWYQLKFDRDSGYLVILHYDRERSLMKNGIENYYEMRRVIQRATEYSKDEKPSILYMALRKKLDNYKDLKANREMKRYDYMRKYKLPKDADRDLTDIANHLIRTGMPKSFIHHFFHVEGGHLIIQPVVNRADIDKNNLDVAAMEKYVWALKELSDLPKFTSSKKAGWYPDGKPPVFTKYKKR